MGARVKFPSIRASLSCCWRSSAGRRVLQLSAQARSRAKFCRRHADRLPAFSSTPRNRQSLEKGLNKATLKPSKSATSRVTSVASWTVAVPAIRESAIVKTRPCRFAKARRRAAVSAIGKSMAMPRSSNRSRIY
jgi:hypothetical protein